VIGVYYDTFDSPEPGDEFMRHMKIKASIRIFREPLSPSGSESKGVRDMTSCASWWIDI
jgi:hypothetical protein